MLFEMLCDQHPFAAERLSSAQVSARISQAKSIILRKHLPNLSADLCAFVETLMAHDPDHRYQNLDAVLADLVRLLNGQPVAVRTLSSKELVFRWLHHHWRIVIATTVAIAMAILVGCMWLQSIELAAVQGQLSAARDNCHAQVDRLKKRFLKSAVAIPQSRVEIVAQYELLRSVRDEFDGFLSQWPDDRKIRKNAGTGFYLLGVAADRLDLEEESVANFYRAEQIFRKLRDDFPEDIDLEFDVFHSILGASGPESNLVEAARLHLVALDIIRRLHGIAPENSDYSDALACVLVEVGSDILEPLGNKDMRRAEQFAREAMALAMSNCDRLDMNPLHRKHIASSADLLRLITKQEGEYFLSYGWAMEAVDAHRMFIQDFPDFDSKAKLIHYLLREAEAALQAGWIDAAHEPLAAGIALYEEISTEIEGREESRFFQKTIEELQFQLNVAEMRIEQMPAGNFVQF